MAVICPTVLAHNADDFREQMEKIAPFAKRIQIDLTDGTFAKPATIKLEEIWWPEGVQADIHLMYQRPLEQIGPIVKLKPHMLIVHSEAELHPHEPLKELQQMGIKVGIAVLSQTPISNAEHALSSVDHLLIFSGDLGKYGGRADLSLLSKIKEAKAVNPKLEIGWDGGINDQNAAELVASGVDVLNVGGFIQNAKDPKSAYAKLEQIAKS